MRVLPLCLALAVPPVSLAGCLPSAPATPSGLEDDDPSRPLDELPPDALAPIDVVALSHEVETVRRLPLKAPIHAQALDPDAFREHLFSQRGGTRSKQGVGPAFWSAFRFAAPDVVIHDTTRRVLAEGVAGFYDAGEKTLFLRGGSGDSRTIVPDHLGDQFTLAHEIEHALQFQTFDIPLTEVRTGDATLALRALLEGDATLTEIAVRAHRRPDTDHWVSRITKLVRSEGLEELLRRSGVKAKELAAAPPLLQRLVTFPYRDGLAFVADLYRTGGLPLINRAFATPPRSTEQVLHTDRYLAGDPPVEVPVPPPPDGWAARGADTMGELGTGVLLSQCVPPEAGVQAARGWGGDTYAFVVDAQGRLAILWSTVWDDAAAAERFERALDTRGDCLRARSAGGDPPGLGVDVVVRRQDRRVVYVQGLGSLGEAQARALLATPVDTPAARPPFGPMTIPPLVVPEEAFLRQGEFAVGSWASEELGMRMALPEGFSPDSDRGLEASMKHRFAHAAFTMLMTAPGEATDRAFLRQLLAKTRKDLRAKDQALDYVASGPMPVDGTAAPSYTWRIANRGVLAPSSRTYLTVAFLPACAGKGTIVLVFVWGGEDGKLAVDDWVKHFSRPGLQAPVCTYLTHALD